MRQGSEQNSRLKFCANLEMNGSGGLDQRCWRDFWERSSGSWVAGGSWSFDVGGGGRDSVDLRGVNRRVASLIGLVRGYDLAWTSVVGKVTGPVNIIPRFILKKGEQVQYASYLMPKQ